MTWEQKTLDQLGFVGRGKSKHRPRDAQHLYGGDFPFIQTGDVKHADLHITNYSQTYSEAGLAQSKLWKKGTLCITIAANIADTAILGFDACFPDSVIGFIPDTDKADVRFVKYLFDTLQKQFQQFSQGAAQDNLSQEKLLSLKFSVPPVELQEKIADILSSYDCLIENNRRRMRLLEYSAQLLYREWFVCYRFPGHEHVEVNTGVPEGWQKTSADAVMDILSGGTPKTSVTEYWDGVVPFFTPKDATGSVYVIGTERSLTEKGLSSCSSALYPKDAVFITARGTVGKLNLAQSAMAMNQSCYALFAREPLTQYFLYFALRSNIEEFRSRAGGSVFDAIVRDTFKLIPFLLPPERLVTAFTEAVTPIVRQIENLLVQNHKLKAARDLMLPRLMNGEILV